MKRRKNEWIPITTEEVNEASARALSPITAPIIKLVESVENFTGAIQDLFSEQSGKEKS